MPTLVEHLRELLADCMTADAPPEILQWAEAHPLAQLGVGGLRDLIYQCLYEPAPDAILRPIQTAVACAAIAYGSSYLLEQIRCISRVDDPEEVRASLNHELTGVRAIRLLLPDRDGEQPSSLSMVLDTMTVFAQSPTEIDLDHLRRTLQMARLTAQISRADIYERLLTQMTDKTTVSDYDAYRYYYLLSMMLWNHGPDGIRRLDLWNVAFVTEVALISRPPGDVDGVRAAYRALMGTTEQKRQEKQTSTARWGETIWTAEWYRQKYGLCRWQVTQYCNLITAYRSRLPIDWQVPRRPLHETVVLDEHHQRRMESLSRAPPPAPQAEALLTPEQVPPKPPVPSEPAPTAPRRLPAPAPEKPEPTPAPPAPLRRPTPAPPAPRPILVAPPPGWTPPVLMAPLPQWVSPPPPAPTTGGAPPRRRSKLQITVSPNPN